MTLIQKLQIRLGTPEHFALTSIFDREVPVSDSVYKVHSYLTSMLWYGIHKLVTSGVVSEKEISKDVTDAIKAIGDILHNEQTTRPESMEEIGQHSTGIDSFKAWISIFGLKAETDKLVAALGLESIEVEFLDDNPQRNEAGFRLFLQPLAAFGYNITTVIVESNKKEASDAAAS
jgi:hypothetical protein